MWAIALVVAASAFVDDEGAPLIDPKEDLGSHRRTLDNYREKAIFRGDLRRA